MNDTTPPAPAHRPRRRRTADDTRTALLRAIADGYTVDELLDLPFVKAETVAAIISQYNLRADGNGVLHPPKRDAREWALVLAEHSRSVLVRNKARRIRLALKDLDNALEEERLTKGTRRRIGLYRERQLTALRDLRLTLREAITDIDEEITRVRTTSNTAMAAEMDAELNGTPGRAA